MDPLVSAASVVAAALAIGLAAIGPLTTIDPTMGTGNSEIQDLQKLVP